MNKLSLVTLITGLTLTTLADIAAVTPATRDDNWMKRHEKHLKLAQAGGAPIIFIGDSITENWTHPDRGRVVWNRFFNEGVTKALNFGISADRTEHILWRVENGELDGFEAKLVVLMAGINNIDQRSFENEPPADTIIGIKTLLNAIKKHQPKAKILLHPIFPRADEGKQRRIDVVNFELWKFCDGINIFWCDFNDKLTTADGRYPCNIAPDGLHPNTIGYEIWASMVLPYARAAVADAEMPVQRFPARVMNSQVGFGVADKTITPMTGMEYRMHWFERLRKHRQAIAENTSKKYDVVFCGDSITELWESYGKEVYPDITNRFQVLNLGYCGDCTEHLLWRLKNGEGHGYRAKLFMVMIGTNNAWWYEAKTKHEGIIKVVNTIKELHPEAKILLMPIFPRGEAPDNVYRKANAEASEKAGVAFANDPKVIYLDINSKFLTDEGVLPKAMFPDFLHPKTAGYRIWCDSVMPIFEKSAK